MLFPKYTRRIVPPMSDSLVKNVSLQSLRNHAHHLKSTHILRPLNN